ncbi:sugar transporter protein [Sarracenia purpurea var. burkii]
MRVGLDYKHVFVGNLKLPQKEEKEIADKYNSVKQLGGTTYLNLDNEDEPFLHEIKHTAMPPTKRFRDMEQLSGGEKTVVALALLFSIHR